MSKSFAAFVLVAAAALAAVPASAADTPATAPATGPAPRPALPQTPGFHHLFYTCKLDNKPRKVAYVLYLPKGYDPNRPCPMVVYLCGAGEKGDNHEGVYGNGPPLSLRADKALADWMPCIVLSPQCPPDLRWDSPGVPQIVLDITELARQSLAVDPNRVYLTGLSMGGAGVWQTALIAKGQFAAIAPICAIEVAADKMADALRGRTVWIICGGDDGGYTQGSRKMFKVLHDAKVDVFYTEVPGQQHGVWPPFYASRQFYEFLLMHALGQRPTATRPAEEKLLAIAYTPPNSADAQLAAPFAKFLPWWYLSNCGKENSPGPRPEALGRKNVFVTMPIDSAVPCRLLYTTAIPKDKKTTLDLAVAAHPKGQWELVVRADGNDLLRRTIDGEQFGKPATQPSTRPASQPATALTASSRAGRAATQPASAPGPWVEVSVNLSNLAAEEVHLELVNRGTGSPHAEAYWGKIELTSRPLEMEKALPGWSLADCNLGGDAGLQKELLGRRNAFVTAPLNQLMPCRLTRTLSVPKDKLSTLRLLVAHPDGGAWQLAVRGNGKELLKETIGSDGNEVGGVARRIGKGLWREVNVDLTPFAGSEVRLEILNASAGNPRTDAYWGSIDLLSADLPIPADSPRYLTMFLIVTGGLLLYCVGRVGRRVFRRKG